MSFYEEEEEEIDSKEVEDAISEYYEQLKQKAIENEEDSRPEKRIRRRPRRVYSSQVHFNETVTAQPNLAPVVEEQVEPAVSIDNVAEGIAESASTIIELDPVEDDKIMIPGEYEEVIAKELN